MPTSSIKHEIQSSGIPLCVAENRPAYSSPDPQPDATVLPFTQLLEEAICSNVQVRFPATAEILITLGELESLLCEGNTQQVVDTQRVKAGTVVSFRGCGFEADIEEGMIKVEGRVELTDCKVRNLKGNGLELRGEVTVNSSSLLNLDLRYPWRMVLSLKTAVRKERFSSYSRPGQWAMPRLWFL